LRASVVTLSTLSISIAIGACARRAAEEPVARTGDEIVVCGQFCHTGAPVVLWTDPGGYDAYRVECRFTPDRMMPTESRRRSSPARYDTFRGNLPASVAQRVWSEGWTLPLLQQQIDLFVLHYDVCGTSRVCFKVLHDMRGLSSHFLLDVDGTIYQTLDVKERARHSGPANDRSVGVEIANMGAYEDEAEFDKWYKPDAGGWPVFQPNEVNGSTGIRTRGFVARPSRRELVAGRIHDRDLYQYDLTDAQYDSLAKLSAALCRALPRILPDAPRAANGEVRKGVLSPDELAKFRGILGHYHVTEDKIDPGPAMNWARLFRQMRAK